MSVTCTGENRELTAVITGEVDHHQAGEIMARLEEHIDRTLPRTLTVDLGGVSFMDSSGIAVLLRAWRRVGELGGRVRVVGAPPQAARVLRAAGVDRLFPLTEKKPE